MLYLEDYLEMIEHLPQELRDRFTEMRELDLQVQNSIDSLDKKTRAFFLQCKRGELQNEALDAEFENLRKEYYKVLEDADEKVTIATQIHELVERYLRRLDSELYKFKCELEADNNGITEILEKRSLEMDGNSSAASALLNYVENNIGGLSLPAAGPGAIKETRYRTPKPEKRRDSISTTSGIPEKRQNLGNSLTPSIPPVAAMRPITPSLSGHAVLNTAAVSTPGAAGAVPYSLGSLGAAGSNAIAVAASQAIVATQQMQQGRRTASLKASYEAIHGVGGGPPEFWISRDIANAANAAAQSTVQATSSEKKHKKKLNSSLSHATSTGSNATLSSGVSLASSSSSVSADSVDMLGSSSGTGISTLGVSANAYNSGASTSAAAASRNSVANVSASSAASVPSANLGLSENGLAVEQAVDGEWSYDPNEPRYCTCNQVSYGDMVACDNDACPYEWFHYPCVGITQPPKGKWYCPKCTASMRRRGNRKN